MKDNVPGLRAMGVILVLVLSIRLLAWTAQAAPAGAAPRLNQTIPTRTPTPPPQTPQTPPPTNTAGPTPTAQPTQTGGPWPPTRTPVGAPSATETPAPSGTTAANTPMPPGTPMSSDTIAPDTPAPEPVTGSPPTTAPAAAPGATSQAPGGPAAPPNGSAEQTASIEGTAADLPAWTPAVAGQAAPAGASCVWPLAGLLLMLAGGALLAWSSHRSRKSRKDHHAG